MILTFQAKCAGNIKDVIFDPCRDFFMRQFCKGDYFVKISDSPNASFSYGVIVEVKEKGIHYLGAKYDYKTKFFIKNEKLICLPRRTDLFVIVPLEIIPEALLKVLDS